MESNILELEMEHNTKEIKKCSHEIITLSKLQTFNSFHITAVKEMKACVILGTDDKQEKWQKS